MYHYELKLQLHKFEQINSWRPNTQQVCSQNFLRGYMTPQKVNLLDLNVDLLNLTPLTKAPFLIHFMAKCGPFG